MTAVSPPHEGRLTEPEDVSAILPSQRALFDVPAEVCYLNAAGWSPLPRVVQEAAHIGVARKGQPWKIDAEFAKSQYERARSAAATLINAEPSDVCIIPSVSYGFAVVGKILKPAPGSRLLVLENDHASGVLEWMTRSEELGFAVETVAQPADGDWTAALLEAIERPGALPLSVASIASVHWSDGGIIDLYRVRTALQMHGAALVIDATQSVGVLTMNTASLDPDFLIFPTYKWVLGPYGRAFMYVARRHQGGIPLEQTSFGRRDVVAENSVYFRDMRYLPDARRYDMGERDHFISLEMASIGMEIVAAWGPTAIALRLAALTRQIAEGLAGSNISLPDVHLRAPHILSLTLPEGVTARLLHSLRSNQVYVASRLGRLRVSPHVYNDEADMERFISIVRHHQA